MAAFVCEAAWGKQSENEIDRRLRGDGWLVLTRNSQKRGTTSEGLVQWFTNDGFQPEAMRT